MKNIKNCPTQDEVIDTIINNIDIRGINKNRFYVEICKLFNNYQNKTSITYNSCITHLQNKFNIDMIEKQYNMKNTKPKYKRIIWR